MIIQLYHSIVCIVRIFMALFFKFVNLGEINMCKLMISFRSPRSNNYYRYIKKKFFSLLGRYSPVFFWVGSLFFFWSSRSFFF
ncbi:hypothetical protein GLOIN_2v704123 [Rhizophagus irregularis DAOM 181602=DAOM 197198]|uniref:Uncharacterized protein n=1 Tax=Rhizophagus irregularis (strain DAOM 181602 / DAOM 197198 / MUCL 43194) TaxID=747089 RepID=A0A2P4QKT4_RHIID|nr:hypothetical protein GLOIN_2v704123 [Rhizophagus irregularis DAOM 181602=DAOM 197198]POG78269.1 hypothetical protein GLOIN_2v704123 [Rhizophagus irregularis DAOM 181602=DAOM 197198]GET53501.1 hypothetical protein GLOIN_2v704123 [Rhizophagus irregularis DAOM 181602=DAOM 197198]|eukprot:XP_025185135.1 hypothetical protein GLOIN_2v704123 [Rhizophagus irregularis DAOM 181602=DAOM 197198]